MSSPVDPDGTSILELARTGLVLKVPPGVSILDVVRQAAVAVASNCEQGTCGACETTVIAGVPDHFDAVLSPVEKRAGKSMITHYSGALSERLMLDL